MTTVAEISADPSPFGRILSVWRLTARLRAMAAKFMAVGMLNTIVGYSVILLALWLGAGDYLANACGYAVGLCLAFFLHRRWTFTVAGRASVGEARRFLGAAMVAYAANVTVIYLGQPMIHVPKPLLQAAAMATYSVTFFVLNRFVVFAGAGARASEARRLRWGEIYPECALVCLAGAIWLAMLGLHPGYDVIWQFWIARQLLGGAWLYSQIWEVNPPLWFWSAMPVEWLAERSGIAWPSLLVTLVVGLGVTSAWLVGHLIEVPRQRDRLGIILLVFVMAIVLPMPQVGQREQLALMTCLPYAALIARRQAGQSVPVSLAVAIAILGAYGFALKHYFTLVPLILELWLWLGLRLRQRWRPWRPELIVLATLAAVYAASVLVFAPDFLSVMVPIVRAGYFAFDPPLYFALIKPYVLFWAVAAAFLVLTRDAPMTEMPPAFDRLYEAILLTAAAFALGYFLQRKGWDYHSVPATGALALALALRIMRFKHALPAAVGTAVLIGLGFYMYPARGHPVSADTYFDRVPAGESVFLASLDASAAWSPDRPPLKWVSRAYSMWMVPAIAKGELVGPNTPELRHLAAQVLAATSEDIRCNPPYLILIENMPAIEGAHGTFTLRDFLFRDAALRRFVAEHYSAEPATPRGTAYLRRDPVSRVAGLHCRAIR